MSDKGRNKGRRLLAIRNLIASESDPARLRKLRKEEVLTLADLGNLPAAKVSSEKLIVDYPDWPAACAVAADVACRAGDWVEAERLFSLSADSSEASGSSGSALHIRTGPLFRLAEARGDHEYCLQLASGTDELSLVLTSRTHRRMKDDREPLEATEGFLPSRLWLLEAAWDGELLEDLPVIAGKWGGPEPEWLWRFIVEGFDLFSTADMPVDPWRSVVAGVTSQVLDPRYGRERHRLSRALGSA